MIKKLEVIVYPKPNKRKEFSQSLQNLSENLLIHCSSLKIDEQEDSQSFNIIARWGKMDHMRKALRSEEFLILSGAIKALCEKIVIRLDDKQMSNNISELIKI